MNKYIYVLLICGGLSICQENNQNVGANTMNYIHAKINTTKGDILINLEFERTPMTVANFVGLSEGNIKNTAKDLGVPYFNNLKFHRVIEDFMVQGGDPEGSGRGGPGYNFSDEFHPDLKHDSPGILSMANSGPGTNGSQFFITHKETSWLDNKHTVFGKVIEGQDVVNSIEQGDLINSVTIIRNGKSAEGFNAAEIFESKQKELKKIAEEKAKQQQKELEELTKDAIETDSELKYIITQEGEGPKPKFGDMVVVHYSGFLMNGTKFDSSVDRGEPFEFELGGRVIQGWNEGIALLNKGAKAKFIIPPHLGYGTRGAGGVIPPNATLIFEVELIDFFEKSNHEHDHSDPNHKH